MTSFVSVVNLNTQISHISQNIQFFLPSNCNLTNLIILFEHRRHLHSGAQATLAVIRLKFWPINYCNAAQKILRKCIACFKVNPLTSLVQMGNLPKDRVTPQRPFVIQLRY